jgi:hypothetical protein
MLHLVPGGFNKGQSTAALRQGVSGVRHGLVKFVTSVSLASEDFVGRIVVGENAGWRHPLGQGRAVHKGEARGFRECPHAARVGATCLSSHSLRFAPFLPFA